MDNQARTISGIQKDLREKKYKAEELFKETFKKIKKEEHKIGAFITLNEEEVLIKGRKLDRKIEKGTPLGDLEGALYSVKDNIMVKNQKCTCGSNMLKNFVAPYDAESVVAVNDSGGIALGKTNLDEFAMGSSSEYSAFKVTRNPRDHQRVAGGSSGGSAAAVAAGFGEFSLGSDTGGSVRQPASFCGVLGLKPTYGLVSRMGLVSFAPSMDQIGIMANNCWDTARVLTHIQGSHPRYRGKESKDYTGVRTRHRSYYRDLRNLWEQGKAQGKKPLEDLTVGIPEEFFEGPMENGVEKAMDKAMEGLRKQGARLISLSVPHFSYGMSSYYVLAMVEAVSNLARFDGVAFGKAPSKAEDIRELIEKSRSQGFGKEVKRRLLLGSYILNHQKEALYRAKEVQRLLRKDFEKAFQQADLLFTPTSNITAFKPGKKGERPSDMQQLDELTVSASLVGLPAISVPCQDSGELPVGGQLIGNYFQEVGLLMGALSLESYFERRSEDQ